MMARGATGLRVATVNRLRPMRGRENGGSRSCFIELLFSLALHTERD